MVWDEIQDGKNKGNSTDSRISEVVELFAHKKGGNACHESMKNHHRGKCYKEWYCTTIRID